MEEIYDSLISCGVFLEEQKEYHKGKKIYYTLIKHHQGKKK